MSQKKIIMKPQSAADKVKPSNLEIKVKETYPLKVIVRRLPPSLTAESFLKEVAPLAEHNYFNFVPADRSLGQYGFGKAVINFKNSEDLFIFREQFDNYVFVDARGNEYPAVVEYAPYQKIPLKARKIDHRENTLDNDPEYMKFVESLENPETTPSITIKEVIEEVDAKAKERLAALNSETPLLAFINKFKVEKRKAQEKLKEERRLREIEKKRLKEEERRLRRDRERREAAESSKHKDLTIKTLAASSSAGDRKADPKKAKGRGETKPQAAPGKPGVKAFSESKSSTGISKAAEKPGKYSSANQKHSKDEIIVRTLPSSKSKSSKQAVEKNQPSQTKGQTQQKPMSAQSSRPATAKDGEKKYSSASPQKPSSGKQETSGNKGATKPSEKYPSKQQTKATSDDTKIKDQEKEFNNGKPSWDRALQAASHAVDDLSDKSRTAKLKDRTKSAEAPETTSKSSRTADKKIERSVSEESNTSISKSADNLDVDSDRPNRTPRNIRYKDRPERAIYNPAARAAERRQKQQPPAAKKATNKDSQGD